MWQVNSWLQHVRSSSFTRNRTWAPALGVLSLSHGATSHQGSPLLVQFSTGLFEAGASILLDFIVFVLVSVF